MECLEGTVVGMPKSAGMEEEMTHKEPSCSPLDKDEHEVTSKVSNLHGDGYVREWTVDASRKTQKLAKGRTTTSVKSGSHVNIAKLTKLS